jgi:hypothetical protein
MRRIVSLLAAVLLGLGGAAAIATPAFAATCQNQAPNGIVEINDSYECLGPQYHWGSYTATYYGPSGACYNLHAPLFWDAGHPSPNGWGNAASSWDNGTRHQLKVYDGFNCTLPLFTLGPGAWYDRPIAGHNNTPSSVWLKCVRIDCS